MEMLLNPQLKDMSAEDLNQRYAHTHVQYKGIPAYIHGFVTAGGKKYVELAKIANSFAPVDPTPFREIFKWDQLNAARPRAGWYPAVNGEKEDAPLLFSYGVKRQWKRGLCDRNTTFFCPQARHSENGDYYYIPLASRDLPWSKITDADLSTPRTVVPRPDRALVYMDQHQYSFFLRQSVIANVDLQRNVLEFLRPNLEQEVFEVSASPLLNGLKVETNLQKEEEPAKYVGLKWKIEFDGRLAREIHPQDEEEREDAPEEEPGNFYVLYNQQNVLELEEIFTERAKDLLNPRRRHGGRIPGQVPLGKTDVKLELREAAVVPTYLIRARQGVAAEVIIRDVRHKVYKIWDVAFQFGAYKFVMILLWGKLANAYTELVIYCEEQ